VILVVANIIPISIRWISQSCIYCDYSVVLAPLSRGNRFVLRLPQSHNQQRDGGLCAQKVRPV